MNWELECLKGSNYVKVTCKGAFSVEEHPECFKMLFASSCWKPGMNLLFDNRNYDFGYINLDRAKNVSEQYQRVSEQLGAGKMALLTKSTLNFGLGRQFELVSQYRLPGEIRVFKDEKATLDWLSEDNP